MSTDITMPKLSDTMTEGRLIAWKKGVGEKVARGEIIAEVETDKATMELEAFASGVLLEVRVKSGEMALVGTVIGTIGAAEETAAVQSAPGNSAEEAPIPPKAEQITEQTTEPIVATVPANVPAGSRELPDGSKEPPLPATSAGESPLVASETGEKASPLVRRLAREQGIDLGQVTGSGPEGRILHEDLEGYPQARGARHEAQGEAVTPAESDGRPEAKPLSRMRAAIARTVAESWRTIPHFTVTMAIDMGEAERVRQELKYSGSPISLNDLLVKASAIAIGKFPLVNASFVNDAIISPAGITIGIAVALDDGLLVPVIRGCQSLSLQAIALRSRELVEKARSGKLGAADLGGGTFTISNLGMFGVEQFMAIILPSQGAVLAVGAVMDQPVIKGGHLAAARIMRVTLSADHRLLDGAYAAQFLVELKRMLENPVLMLV